MDSTDFDDRRARNSGLENTVRKARIAIVLLVAASAGLVSLWADSSADVAAIAVAIGLVIGVVLAMVVIPAPDAIDPSPNRDGPR